MIITGACNRAEIFTDVIDDGAVAQIRAMCDFPAFEGEKIRVMPDVHAGKGCTIGMTMTISGRVVPNMVGVDIGCGMETIGLSARTVDFAALDALIRREIPSGTNCRQQPLSCAEEADLSSLRCGAHINAALAVRSVGTLGGGNHFIEVDEDESGKKYLVIHSGSRHLGVEVAGYYQELAYDTLSGRSEAQRRMLIERMKAEGNSADIAAALAQMRAQRAPVDPAMAYLEGGPFYDYLHDMKIVQRYAALNRRAMADIILGGMGWTADERFTTIHNYIDTEHMILRKGAVSAQLGERLLIPINMRDGALICVGRGNENWNCSAPHGAGRLLSRGKAMQTLSVEEFEREMRGIYSTTVGKATLDESPMAYKKPEDIIGRILPTAVIEKRIFPVYNFKAAETPRYGKKRA